MGLRMNPKLRAEIEKQAKAHGVSPEDVLGVARNRAASAARRAVWANLVTRYPGGKFPASELARLFNRQPQIVLMGIKMHEQNLTRWPNQAAPSEIAAIKRMLEVNKKRYALMGPRDPQRKAVRAECARLKALLDE